MATGRSSMKTYRITQLFLHCLIVGYILAALAVGFGRYHREIFPIPSWSLFSHVFAQKSEFAVLVVQVDGERFETPREFMDAGDLFNGAGNIRAYYTIQDLGRAIIQRDADEMQRLRRLLEATYMKSSAERVDYQLILRSFDPIERWQGGAYRFRPVANLVRESGEP